MDLNSLNTFIAIAETGSFSEAGERLHLTQPAVSKRIAALEQQLNARLFDRVGREVNLTEAGRALLPRAYQLLNVLDDTRRALNNLTGEVSGRLVLATSHHIGLHRLPPLLRAFTRAHPQVALDIQFLDSEVAYEEILHGRAELAVITLAPETAEPVRAVPVGRPAGLRRRPGAPAGPTGHGVPRRRRQAPRGIPRRQHLHPPHRAAHVRSRRADAEHRHEHHYLETIKMMVSIGLAWSVLPRTMLDDQVVRLPLQDIQLSRQLGYILHTERTLSNAARAFMRLLDEQAFGNGTPAA